MTANKTMKPYTIVSYFCGCGGLDLGFRGGYEYRNEKYPRLPFQILDAYDFNEKCVATYNDYFGDCAHVADLSKIDAKDVPAADVLIGGFPCQEFSSCGPLGGLDSERGQLYKALLRYMKEHSLKVVVGENVINLVQTRQAARLYVKRTDRVREASLLVQTRQAARLYIINTGRKHNGRLLKAFTDFTE